MKSTPLSTPSRCPIHRLMAWFGWTWENSSSAASSGRCPMGFDAPESEFIEKARQETATAPILPGDPAAQAFLQEARAAIYHWPENFPGFACQLEVRENDQTWSARLEARSSRQYQIQAPTGEPPGGFRWLRFHLEEFLAHREHPKVAGMTSATGVTFGDDHPIYGRRVDFLGDKMGSFYHIRDRKIRLIGRSYPRESFLITIDRHAEHHGRFAATDYSAFYWDRSKGHLLRCEQYRDDYTLVDDHLLPAARVYTVTEPKTTLITREIRFVQPQLLTPTSVTS